MSEYVHTLTSSEMTALYEKWREQVLGEARDEMYQEVRREVMAEMGKPRPQGRLTKTREAEEFLVRYLPMPSTDVDAAMDERGISKRIANTAKKNVNATSTRKGDVWWWEFPDRAKVHRVG